MLTPDRQTWSQGFRIILLVNISSAQHRPSIVRPGTLAWNSLHVARSVQTADHAVPSKGGHPGGKEPLDEVIVELPHVLIHVSHLDHHSPGLAAAANLGVSGLAGLRAVQCFQIPGVAAKMEGAAALSLAVASVAAALPGGVAHSVSHGATGAHGLLELGLGTHQLVDALHHREHWKQVADGALGAIKGAAALTPLFAPGLETASHLVELGALLGRLGLNVSH
jgi:hypothetical protein